MSKMRIEFRGAQQDVMSSRADFVDGLVAYDKKHVLKWTMPAGTSDDRGVFSASFEFTSVPNRRGVEGVLRTQAKKHPGVSVFQDGKAFAL